MPRSKQKRQKKSGQTRTSFYRRVLWLAQAVVRHPKKNKEQDEARAVVRMMTRRIKIAG